MIQQYQSSECDVFRLVFPGRIVSRVLKLDRDERLITREQEVVARLGRCFGEHLPKIERTQRDFLSGRADFS